jgi:outer membrane murein-binding lipoprotein Lpp
VADNLNITIGADTSKLRADLKLAEAALRDLIKQERLLAQEAQKTGDRGKLDAITPSVVAAEKSVRSLRGELNKTSFAMDVLAQKSTRRLLTQFNDLGRTTQNIAQVFGGLAGGFAGGFLAGAVVKGVQQLSDSLANVNAELIRVRDLGREIGARPMAIQAFGEIAKEAGGSAADAEKAITGVAQAFEKFRTEAGAAATGGVMVMRGSLQRTADAAKEVTSNFSAGVAVLRGSAPLVFELAKSYEMLGVNQAKYKATQEGQLKLTIDTFAAFQRAAQQKLFDPIQLNAMSKFLFGGVPADSMLKIIPGEIDKLTAKLKELAGAPRGIKADDIIAQEELDKAKTRMDKIFADVFASLNRQNVASQTAINNLFADFLGTTLPGWGAGVSGFFANFFPKLQADWESSWQILNANFLRNQGETIDQLLARWQGYFTSLLDIIQKAASAASSTLSKSFPGDPGGAPAMPAGNGGFAGGGLSAGRDPAPATRSWRD